MAMNLDEARAMIAARPTGKILQIVPAPFSLGWDALVKDWVEKRLGRLLSAHVDVASGVFADATAPLDWRQDRDKSGDNIMFLGIYYEMAMRWLGEVSEVQATATNAVSERISAESGSKVTVTIPDILLVTGRYPGGGLLSLRMSTALGGRKVNEIWIYGEAGSIHFDLSAARLRFIDRGGEREVVSAATGPGWRVEAEFVGAILGREPVRYTTPEAGVRYMAFTAAVQESLRSRQFATVSP